jgi:hypothetical protein
MRGITRFANELTAKLSAYAMSPGMTQAFCLSWG